MLYSGTDPESYITEFTLVYEEHSEGVGTTSLAYRVSRQQQRNTQQGPSAPRQVDRTRFHAQEPLSMIARPPCPNRFISHNVLIKWF